MEKAHIIQYRDFWDVPRIFLASFEGAAFLFDCKFDEHTEDFSDKYEVFLMPDVSENDLRGSWHELAKKAVRSLGEIPVSDVRFDQSCRKYIDAEPIFVKLRG